jgi:hypothetical protein
MTRSTSGRLAVCGVASPSVTVAVKLDAPTCVGVPLITPAVERVMPGGRPPAVTV